LVIIAIGLAAHHKSTIRLRDLVGKVTSTNNQIHLLLQPPNLFYYMG